MDGKETQEDSSFSNQLKSRLKKGLKPTSTKLTNPDGTVCMLEKQGLDVVPNKGKNQKGLGFVVDTKPDLTIGQIRPLLFISSQDVPNDVSILSQNRITHILSLLPGFQLSSLVKPLVKAHLTLEVFDEVNFDLQSPEIKKALEFIHTSLSGGHRVLIHCNAGISRAPSIAILYLMKKEGLDFSTAYEEVKKGRPNAKPNEGFLHQLKAL